MYGYVLPNKETLAKQDHIMFQSLYCGSCLSIKEAHGNISRLTTNYDMTVFGLIAIEAARPSVEFETRRCIADFRKRGVVKNSGFLKKLCAVNILLTYYKATDDLLDSGGKKKLARYILRNPYKKAKGVLPEADAIISEEYDRLRGLERESCANIDRVCDCFASMLERLMSLFIKERKEAGSISDCEYNNFRRLCYNIGKFVYLADALDDIGSDNKKGNYNPFLVKYGDFEKGGRQAFIQKHYDEISFLLSSTINRVIECSNGIIFTEVNDLIRNVIYEGLRKKAAQLLASTKQLPAPKL